MGDLVSIPGLGRFPGGGQDNSLQYSCMKNPHGQRSLASYSPWVIKSQIQLSAAQHSSATSHEMIFAHLKISLSLTFEILKPHHDFCIMLLCNTKHFIQLPQEVFWQDSSMNCCPFSLQGFLSSTLRWFWGAAFTYLEVIRDWFEGKPHQSLLPNFVASLYEYSCLEIPDSQVTLVLKNLPASAGDVKEIDSVLGSGTSPGGRYGNPLQYSCLENPRGPRGPWWTTVCGSHKESDMTG